MFNVATVAHGDEAVLAAAYLFTVHYFVNHWRPDKFPLDIVMFTGAMPLDEFKREYGVEYARLVANGELQQHLVDAPSPPLRLGSKILGFCLVAVGLALLVMMAIGFGDKFFELDATGRPHGTLMSTNSRVVALYYSTRDGQARRIAEHICGRLAENGPLAPPQDVAIAKPTPEDLAAASLIVLVAAVRYGKHLPEADQFLTTYRSLVSPPPLALASVNLTARKPEKTTATGNAYLRKAIARHGLAPTLAVAFAGRLDYRRYNWRDRQIIRFIMLLTGGPTAPHQVEYTSWDAVDDFAARIEELRRQN